MKKFLFILAALLILAAATIWGLARDDLAAAQEQGFALVKAMNQGEIPGDLPLSARGWAETLLEFGPLQLEVQQVRPVFFRRATLLLRAAEAQSETTMSISLKKEKGGWRIIQAPEATLAVQLSGGEPHLALLLENKTALIRPLIPLGRDKLLTLESTRSEWLRQGWQEHLPWFRTYLAGREGSLRVGLMAVELYGWKDNLAAALVAEEPAPDTIRVNISTSGFNSIYHPQVQVSSSAAWQATAAYSGESWALGAGTYTIKAGAQGLELTGGGQTISGPRRLLLTPEPGKPLTIASISRAGKEPAFFGSLEVALLAGGIVVANELPLEQYLLYVVPSEMPANFGVAALEVQAIAARTFAVANIYFSSWQKTSAHVVDSVLSQVYNNSPANPAATAAIRATRGIIITAEGAPAVVRYFSTSCGYTANAEEVWPGAAAPWLISNPQFPNPGVVPSDEESFREFILNPPPGAYDANSAWFRWRYSLPASQLQEIIAANLGLIHQANPEVLQRWSGKEYTAVAAMPPEPLGELLDLLPLERGTGGILRQVEVRGSLGTWRVSQEYYIRQLLRPQGGSESIFLIRQDGSSFKDFAIMPSAFVFWEKERWGDQLWFSFQGGGYGHGVGLSQYGARELTARGWTAAEIIGHYFPGVQLKDIGE